MLLLAYLFHGSGDSISTPRHLGGYPKPIGHSLVDFDNGMQLVDNGNEIRDRIKSPFPIVVGSFERYQSLIKFLGYI